MNRQNVIKLRNLLEQELTPILKKAGYAFDLGNATFDSDRVHFKGFKISDIGAKSEPLKHLDDYNKFRFYNDEPTFCVQRVVKIGNSSYKLVGYKPKARKNPFIIQDIKTQAQFVLNSDRAEKLFGIKGQT